MVGRYDSGVGSCLSLEMYHTSTLSELYSVNSTKLAVYAIYTCFCKLCKKMAFFPVMF